MLLPLHLALSIYFVVQSKFLDYIIVNTSFLLHQHLADVLSPDSVTGLPCPNQKFNVYQGNRNPSEATAHCLNRGGELATFKTPMQYTAFLQGNYSSTTYSASLFFHYKFVIFSQPNFYALFQSGNQQAAPKLLQGSIIICLATAKIKTAKDTSIGMTILKLSASCRDIFAWKLM